MRGHIKVSWGFALTVIGLLVVFFYFMSPRIGYVDHPGDQRPVRAKFTMTFLSAALSIYQADWNALPPIVLTADGRADVRAVADVLCDKAADAYGPYLELSPERSELTDPWGSEYRLRYVDGGWGVRIWSCGPNGVDEDGAGDDVVVQ